MRVQCLESHTPGLYSLLALLLAALPLPCYLPSLGLMPSPVRWDNKSHCEDRSTILYNPFLLSKLDIL